MGSPTIFSGKYTKLLTSGGVLKSDGATLENDGPKNYITYNNFEIGATTGWSLGTTGTLTNAIPTGTPTFGSGASGNLSLSAVNSGAIRGTRSLSYASSAATTVGNMVASAPLSIDPADRAKVLTFKFYYSVPTNPSNGNFSGTSANSFGVAVYDVTNSAWLGVAGNFSITQNSGVGIASGTFQTNSNTASLRFCVYNANASAGAITVYFDDFYLGPQTAPIGPVVTDWVSWTPTGSWTTNTTYTGRWRRIGDSMEAQVLLSLTGAPTAVNLSVFLPPGYSIDLTKVPGGAATLSDVMGSGQVQKGFTGHLLGAYINGTNAVAFSFISNGSTSAETTVTSTAPVVFANGDTIHASFRVPIQGWSSSVQMSSDTDTRVVAFQTYTQPVATLTGSPSLVRFTTISTDTHAAFNTTTGLYTVPVSGFYEVSCGLNISGTFSANQYLALYLAKNGTGFISNWVPTALGQTATQVSATGTVYCNAGDTLSPQAQTNIGSPSVTTSFGGANYFIINRLSGPSVVAATESVTAVYQTGAGQSIPNNTATPIVYGTKVFDTHSAMNASTGVYSVPVSGTYEVKASHYFGTAILATATDVQTIVQVDGVSMFGSNLTKSGTAATPLTTLGSFLVKANAGQTIRIALLQSNSTASAQSLLANVTFNWISINRVGN